MGSAVTMLEASVYSRTLLGTCGPFMPLLQADFRNGVAMLNRLLNHAARIRVRTLARLDPMSPPLGRRCCWFISDRTRDQLARANSMLAISKFGSGTAEPESDHIHALAHYKHWSGCATRLIEIGILRSRLWSRYCSMAVRASRWSASS